MKVSRINSIEEYVIARGTVSIDELCEAFGVSKNTIRRDLGELETRGRIAKVYGGVMSVPPPEPGPAREPRGGSPANKLLIGRLAAEEVADGDVIFIDSGTTALKLLRYLVSKKKVTVISHSLSALSEASKYSNLSIISLGGVYNSVTDSFVGLSTIEAFSSMRVAKAFMGTAGITPEAGMTGSTFLEAELKRAAVRHAEYAFCLADSTKFDREGVATYCQFEDLEALITDSEPPKEYIKICRTKNVRLKCG